MRKKIWIIVTIVIMVIVIAGISMSRNIINSKKHHHISQLASTPPRGWNSWNSFGFEVTEQEVKKIADYMADSLLEYGWEYLVIDMGWQYPPELKTKYMHITDPQHNIDNYGRLLPDTIKFPSAVNGKGFKPIADYIHSKGLKFGIHIMRGIPWDAVDKKMRVKGGQRTAYEIADTNSVCEWNKSMIGLNFKYPESQQYYNSIFELYAKWGVDFVKVDDVAREFHKNDIKAVNVAMQNCGREMIISLSPGPAKVKHAGFFAKNSNMWRISNDFWDHWKFVVKQIEYCRAWYPFIEVGHWPDCDMLVFGKLRKTGADSWVASLLEDNFEKVKDEYTRFTKDEQITVMSLWSIFRSPLMFGGYMPENERFTNYLLTNREVLEINSYSKNVREIKYDNESSTWLSESLDGSEKYLLFINLKDYLPQNFSIHWDDLGIEGKFKVWDLWQKEEICKSDTGFTVNIPPHGSGFYKISPN